MKGYRRTPPPLTLLAEWNPEGNPDGRGQTLEQL